MKIQLELGALSPSLKMQLKGVLPKAKLDVLDKDAVAISRLYIRGLITESQWRQANKKLLTSIQVNISLASPEKSGKPRLQPK